ncbi:alpha/beta hydrolase [Streptomyces bikiniensis]|uniref:alpha/beta hydrolase n=1 Tax=Streptomyces bikiniensis TaxID=1896 RepID=UPI0004C1AF88|nr:alpha/beta hydrolase [Streptomyces bikiniensis]
MEHVSGPPPVLEHLVQAFVEDHACPGAPDGVDAGYAGMPAALSGEADTTPDIEEEWLALPGCDGNRIRVRILRPAGSDEPLPVILYLHGIGWAHTSATTHQRLLEDLVLGADAAVVVPEYERPSAARYPVAVEQSYTVARWIAENGADCRLDHTRIAVVGVSAGANLAAALTLVAKEREDLDLVHQVLVCPVTDASGQTPSYRSFARGYFLSSAAMLGYWRSYVSDPTLRTEITASPLRATVDDLRGLPPALVITAEADIVRDEGEAYAAKLRAAGVSVVSARYHGTIHAFVLFDPLRESDAARAARIQTVDTLHVALHRSR